MAAEGWEDNPHLRKMYISKLRTTTTEDTLREYFQKYGTVIECNVVKDNEDKSRGYAFLTMDTQATVDNILDEKPHNIDRQLVDTKRAVPRDDPNLLGHVKTKKLFIGGLSSDTTDRDILDVLQIFTSHKPRRLTLMRDKITGNFKGYAFALFDSEDIVDKLFIIRTCTIKNKKVEMKKAEEIGCNQIGPGLSGRRGMPRRGRGGPRVSASGGYSQFPCGGYNGPYGFLGGYGGGFFPGYGYNGFGNFGGGGYMCGFGMGPYGFKPSGYGPNRRGGARRNRGGRGYRPY